MDIDIDLIPGVDPHALFKNAIPASMVTDGVLKKHPVGYYFQDIPVDKVTGLSAIPYKESEDFGYYKIDLLTVNILKSFDSKAEMVRLQKIEPNWDLLKDTKVVEKLFHLGKHYSVINKVKPKSILALADVFALIRPNKRPLLDKYIENPEKYRTELYTKRAPEDMRKAHAIPYAILIVLQLHLVEQGRL
jgi:hypothetical protein